MVGREDPECVNTPLRALRNMQEGTGFLAVQHGAQGTLLEYERKEAWRTRRQLVSLAGIQRVYGRIS